MGQKRTDEFRADAVRIAQTSLEGSRPFGMKRAEVHAIYEGFVAGNCSSGLVDRHLGKPRGVFQPDEIFAFNPQVVSVAF